MSDSSEKQLFVLVGSNASHQVQVFGTKTGLPFKSEKSAKDKAKRLEKEYPHIDVLVMPVCLLPSKEGG